MVRNAIIIALIFGGVMASGEYRVELPQNRAPKKPFILATDIYYPPWDWDDVLDVNLVYAMSYEYLNPLLFIMDEPYPDRGDGKTWRGIYRHVYGRDYEYAWGLISDITTRTDDGSSQPKEYQAGVNRLLEILEKSRGKVVLSTVGSARDFAAAYKRNPELFREKVERVYLSGGKHGDIMKDPNFGSDPYAVKILVEADLPLYIAFCGGPVNNSYYGLELEPYLKITDSRDGGMLSSIVYWSNLTAMEGGYRSKHKLSLQERPPLPDVISEDIVKADSNRFFEAPRDPELESELRKSGWIKGMWSPVNFYHGAGLNIFVNADTVKLDYRDSLPGFTRLYNYKPHKGSFDGDDLVLKPVSGKEANVRLFQINVTGIQYSKAVNAVYREFISRFGGKENEIIKGEARERKESPVTVQQK
jgi:hypothetical protein